MTIFSGHPQLQPPSIKEETCCPETVTPLLQELGGITANRPMTPLLYQMYFDTTIGKPIWWNGTNWVNATGAVE